VVPLGFVSEPWQLYAAYLLLAAGAAALHTGAITTVVGLWFDRRRGLAISLALNGASFGGIVVTPVLVIAIEYVGFRTAMTGAAAIMALAMVPVIAAWVDRPTHAEAASHPSRSTAATSWTRTGALRSLAFWSVAGPLAIALMAQIGFIVHQIAFLEPAMGRTSAGFAVAVMTVMAVAGRIVLGVFIHRLEVRTVTALSVLSQAAALLVMTQTADVAMLFIACAVYGLSVGNMITLPGLIIQREFDAPAFGMLVGLSTAIGQFTCVVGPGLLGLVRDATGGYGAAIGLCIGLELVAAALVMMRPAASQPGGQTAPVVFK
jgi:cyanate permease